MSGFCSAHQGHQPGCRQCGQPCHRCTYVEYGDPDERTRIEFGNEDCYECNGLGVVYPSATTGERWRNRSDRPSSKGRIKVSARDDYPKLHASTSGPHHQGQTSSEAQAALDEIDALRAVASVADRAVRTTE